MKLPLELLQAIDIAARANYSSRTSYIREAIVLRLNGQQIVEKPNEEDRLKAIFDKAIAEEAAEENG